MRMIALLAALALAVPAAALATKPPTPGHSTGDNGKAAPKVTYVLRGTLSLYTAATDTSTGTVTLLVKHANHHGHTLEGQTLQFTLTTATKVVADGGTIADHDRGLVKVRAPKKLSSGSTLAADLQALTPRQVVDQGPTH